MEKYLTLGPVIFQSRIEDIPETQYFLIGQGKVKPCSEETIVSQEYDTEFEIPVEVETIGGAFYIESTDWYGSEGICRLSVNYFSLDTALRIFGELVSAFTKAESDWRAEADKEIEAEDFATAICALLCEIENGGASDSITAASANLRAVTKAAFKSEAEPGETLSAVAEQFAFFEDIG